MLIVKRQLLKFWHLSSIICKKNEMNMVFLSRNNSFAYP